VFTLLVLFGKIIGVTFGAFLSGVGVRTSVRAGMSLAQIGEFSFIIAGLAHSLRVTGEVLYPVAVAVSAITTLSTPFLIKRSDQVARFVDHRLPPALHTFTTLYSSWVERMRSTPRGEASEASARRLYKLLAIDALILGAIVIGTAVYVEVMVTAIENRLQLTPLFARSLLAVLVIAAATPFCIGIFRVAHHLGETIAQAAMPEPGAGWADAPRLALVAMIQFSAILLVALPLLALTQPFLRGPESAFALILLIGLFGLSVWRSATKLEGHVKAGAQMFMAALTTPALPIPHGEGARPPAAELLHGLGEPIALRLKEDSGAVGRTLANLNLRGLTGATVLAITRRDGGVVVPTGQEQLNAGDVLALAGTKEALQQASRLLADHPPAPASARDGQP